MSALPREIITTRLRLRPPRPADADLVFARWTADSEITRYLSWRPHGSVEDTRAWLTLMAEAWEHGGDHMPWLMELLDGAGPVGAIGLTIDGHRVQVGYGLCRSHWGRGMTSEALSAVIDVAIELPGIHRVWAYCDFENAASARVMERAGMVYEGTLQRWAVHPNVSDLPRDVLAYVVPSR